MNQKYGVFIFLGLEVGGIFGVFLGAAIAIPVLGIALGAAGGVFLGWFIAASAIENQDSTKSQ